LFFVIKIEISCCFVFANEFLRGGFTVKSIKTLTIIQKCQIYFESVPSGTFMIYCG